MSLDLKEKFYGCLFGGAIGDALGLGTEFMMPNEISRRYPDGLHDYSQIIRDTARDGTAETTPTILKSWCA